jgi:hypothetical protein
MTHNLDGFYDLSDVYLFGMIVFDFMTT